MKLSVVWVGRTKDRRIEALAQEAVEKIGRYCRIAVVEIRDSRIAGKGIPKRPGEEGERVLKTVKPGEQVIALDEGGREMRSVEFAGFLGKALESTPAGVRFILGGPFGLSEEVLKAASHRISLSRMTLTHEMARLVALEQIYRAFTIMRGEGYHH
ncbi:MAG: 23S rRNA (pseudouridine(1915)-N(3))-methyltransferase RlmH [Acidobacteria bacterium]|nr:23S rRNA (pseudouridine(1915)-N(3))-methyltransferase RlmH [Acidobacteriota bacterium]